MNHYQKGSSDFEIRFRDIAEEVPLARLNEVINWETFRSPIDSAIIAEPKGPGERPRFDTLVMFKTLEIW